MNEQKAREYVNKLRRFYTDALIYAVVNLGLILIWAISGGGYFWPIWVIVGWGIGLGVHAFSLGLIPQVNAMVPFMTDEWAEAQIRHLVEKEGAEIKEPPVVKKTKVEIKAPPAVKKGKPLKSKPPKPKPPKPKKGTGKKPKSKA